MILKDSRARMLETQSIHAYMSELRQQLLERGVLVEEGGLWVFTPDYRFASPSMTTGVLVGGASNGRRAWKDRDGVLLKKLQV